MNKFQTLSKEELLKLVERQEKELVSKKYGLVLLLLRKKG